MDMARGSRALNGEVRMADDSSLPYETPAPAPVPGTDEPSLDPDNPNDLDPLRRPHEPDEEGGEAPNEEVPAPDQETPLSDDLR